MPTHRETVLDGLKEEIIANRSTALASEKHQFTLLTKLIGFVADMDQTMSAASFVEKVPHVYWGCMAEKLSKYLGEQAAQDLLKEATRLGPPQTHEEKIAMLTEMLFLHPPEEQARIIQQKRDAVVAELLARPQNKPC